MKFMYKGELKTAEELKNELWLVGGPQYDERKDLDELLVERDELEDRIEELEDELRDMSGEISDMHEELEVLQGKLDELEE